MLRTRTSNQKVFSVKRTKHYNHKKYHKNRNRYMNDKADHKLFKAIKGVIYAEGYHYGWMHIKGSKNKHAYKPIVSRKVYSFIVDSRTHNLAKMHPNNIASVNTKLGKRWLYITNIHHIKHPGKATLNILHKQLRPVIAFHDNTIKNKWFITCIKRNMKRSHKKA